VFDETRKAFSLARLVCRDAAARINKLSTAKAIASAKVRAAVISLGADDRRLAASHEQWDLDPMAWAENNGEFVGSVKRFVHMLEGKGYRQIRRRDGRGFAGLKRA
jgi:hypothetical protein